jgi:hypothetical protein
LTREKEIEEGLAKLRRWVKRTRRYNGMLFLTRRENETERIKPPRAIGNIIPQKIVKSRKKKVLQRADNFKKGSESQNVKMPRPQDTTGDTKTAPNGPSNVSSDVPTGSSTRPALISGYSDSE